MLTDDAAKSLVWKRLEKYRITSHTGNDWTELGLQSVMTHMGHFDAAIAAINGTLSSCFRSLRVNTIVNGSKTSLHLDGLACDIVPGKPHTTATATGTLVKMARKGELGRVREIILEPGWVHIGWHRGNESGLLKVLEKIPGGYKTLTI
jgi:hypothetical protein